MSLIAGAALAGCSGAHVNTEKAPDVDLSQYRSFSWAPPSQQEQSKELTSRPSTILDQKIKATVSQDLQKKGYVANDPNAPIKIAYSIRSENRLRAEPMGSGPYVGPIDSALPTDGYGNTVVTKEGSLVLDFIDSNTGKLLWRGIAVTNVKDTGITQNDVQTLANEIMEEFPTRPEAIG
jgi:hypothetical protein